MATKTVGPVNGKRAARSEAEPEPVRLGKAVRRRLVVIACLDADDALGSTIESRDALHGAAERLLDTLDFVDRLESGWLTDREDVEAVEATLKGLLGETADELGRAVIWESKPGADRRELKTAIRSMKKWGRKFERALREVDRFDLERQELAGELTSLGRRDLARLRGDLSEVA